MKIIDARGQNCPIPVVWTKNAIAAGETAVKIMVDNKTATQNLEKLTANNGLRFSCTPIGSDFEVLITGKGVADVAPISLENKSQWAVFITEKAIGSAPNELGETLMKMYFYTLSQGDTLPAACIFMNEGVKLLENPEILKSFDELEAKGVKLIFCGACLNFYGIADLCRAENISNMYVIMEEMAKYGKVIHL